MYRKSYDRPGFGRQAFKRLTVSMVQGLMVPMVFLVPTHLAATSYAIPEVDPLEGATKIESDVNVYSYLPDYSGEGVDEFLVYKRAKALRERIHAFLHHEIAEAGYEVGLKKMHQYWTRDASPELKDSNFAHRTLFVEVRGSRLKHPDLDSALYVILVKTYLCVDFWRSDRSTKTRQPLPDMQRAIIRDARTPEYVCDGHGSGHVVEPYSRKELTQANDAEIEQVVMRVVDQQVSGLFSIERKYRRDFRRYPHGSWDVSGGRYTIRIAPHGAGDLYQYLQGTTLIKPQLVTVSDTRQDSKDAPIFEFPAIDRRVPHQVLMSPDQQYLVMFLEGWPRHALDTWQSGTIRLVDLYRTNGEYLGALTRREILYLSRSRWEPPRRCSDNPQCLPDPEFPWNNTDHSIDSTSEHLVLTLPVCVSCSQGGAPTTRKIRISFKDHIW